MLKITKETLNELYWVRGFSTLTIGRQYGVSHATINSKMREFNIKRRKPGEYLEGQHMSDETKRKISEAQIGEKSNNWKGGRHIDNHGYMRVNLSIDSPFLPMTHKSKTRKRTRDITEHRLVMAQHLGRCLQGWEIVHHKNGIKTDNRIENLTLLSDEAHKPSTQLARHIKQKEGEAYMKGVEDGKKELLEALFKLAKESPTGTFVIDSHVVNIYEVKQ